MFQVIPFLSNMLIMSVGYIFFVTIVGALHARIAALLGDQLPVYSGMGELNPRYHVDLFGFIFFLITRVGWKRELPLSPNTQLRVWKKLQILLVEPLLYVFCGFVCALLVLIITHQPACLMFRAVPVDAAITMDIAGCGCTSHALLVYVLQNFILFAISLAVTAIFIAGLQLVIGILTYNTMGLRSSIVADMTIFKLAVIGIGFAVFYFLIPFLFKPLLMLVYIPAYFLVGLFIPLA